VNIVWHAVGRAAAEAGGKGAVADADADADSDARHALEDWIADSCTSICSTPGVYDLIRAPLDLSTASASRMRCLWQLG